MKPSGYEYQMSIPSMDAEQAAFRLATISLHSSTGVMTSSPIRICGVPVHTITMKREFKPGSLASRYAMGSLP